MQDFDEIKVPETLVLAIHGDLPDSPIYIEKSIEASFMKALEESGYVVKDTLEKFKEVFSDFKSVKVMHVNTKGAACGPVYETVTFVLRQPKN